jgi:hypothetical protein
MNRDNRNTVKPFLVLNSTISSDTNTDSSEIDTKNYDGGLKFNIFSNDYTDGTYTVQLHASDTTGFTPSSSTLLATDELIPSSQSVAITAVQGDLAVIASVGAITAKRYMVLRVVSTLTSTGANIIATAEAVPEIQPDPDLV